MLGAGLLGGLAVSLLGVGLHELREGEAWMVTEVQIAGPVRAREASLRHLAHVRPGAHLFEVDLAHTVRNIQRHPWVRSATARRVMPGTIEITVEEHQPVALLALGELWLVSAEGLPFKIADGSELDFPVITGVEPALVREHPAVGHAILASALGHLEAVSGHPALGVEHTSELRFDRAGGFTHVLTNGSELYFGFAEPAAAVARFDQLWAAGLRLSPPLRVDLEDPAVALASPLPGPA